MLPFNVKKYTQHEEKKKLNKTACSQQAISNLIVMGSMPQQTNAQPLQQQPAKQ